MRRSWVIWATCAGLLIALGTTGCAPKRVVTVPVVQKSPSDQSSRPANTSWPSPSDPQNNNQPTAELAADAKGERAVELARAQLGKPYQWGAAGPDKFDCSGLVQYVYKNLGVSLPRVSGAQAGSGVHVDRRDLQPGDLVFFRLTGGPINHVGIYVGRGKFIHAPKKNNPVRLDTLNDSWWGQKFKGGRRVG